ncbi:MAG: DUF86 domain-containing protein [Bacteroidales bacterium]|nr:DUF86 domain-containing protein [Bacteroidales bacterium]MCF8457069.1 DUF86 domain-containing protein [Bacteroidales bacterium]
MSKREDILLLEDILESINKLFSYTKDFDFDSFKRDDKTIDAVIRNFEIIGEAANRLSPQLYSENGSVQWHQIIGLRNRLIHGYFGVDIQIIWNIISKDLQLFKTQIESVIAKQK